MTRGEYRVGIDFNPSRNPKVDKIKRAAADLIDLVASIELPGSDARPGRDHNGEVLRLLALAMTHIEDGAMWAVKAITKPPREP